MNLDAILPPSLLAERLESLAYLYARSDAAVDAFVRASGVSCPFGCGTCCEGFVPDILPLEASYIAAFLALKDRPRAYELAGSGLSARRREDGRVGCPLYAEGTPYHCTVYEARPLICRMFAFSAVRDKRGEPSFSVCRLGLSRGGLRSASGAALAEGFGASPPTMADFGSELAALEPDAAVDRRALPEALALALPRVLFLVGMGGSDPDSNGPNLSPPMPKAR